MEFLKVFCAFLLFGLAVSGGIRDCPTLSVSPCTCTANPEPVLICDRLYNTDQFTNVFRNSAGTVYKEVRLTNSVLQYIPHDIFEGVEVDEFHVIDGTLVALFDTTPGSVPSLRVLNIENTFIKKGIDWKQIQPMENLVILNINSTVVKTLGSEFAQYAPKSLTQISFTDTQTVSIEAGVFENFSSLNRVAISHSPLKALSRNMFPVPFQGEYLYFDEAQLSSIPADMFSNMPKLRSISLEGNRLTTLPRDAFKNIRYLNLEGNPLICNCNLAWLMKNGIRELKGTCASPLSLIGRSLVDVYGNTSCRL